MRHRRPREVDASVRNSVVRSQILVRDSKRLLLCVAERRLRRDGSPDDSPKVKRLRADVERAEARCNLDDARTGRALQSTHLLITYARLIATATATVDSLTRIAPSLPPSRRYATAVSVQALDELIDQWGQTSSAAAGDRE